MGRNRSSVSDAFVQSLAYGVVLGVIFPGLMLGLFFLSGTQGGVVFSILQLYYTLLSVGAFLYTVTWLEKKLK